MNNNNFIFMRFCMLKVYTNLKLLIKIFNSRLNYLRTTLYTSTKLIIIKTITGSMSARVMLSLALKPYFYGARLNDVIKVIKVLLEYLSFNTQCQTW